MIAKFAVSPLISLLPVSFPFKGSSPHLIANFNSLPLEDAATQISGLLYHLWKSQKVPSSPYFWTRIKCATASLSLAFPNWSYEVQYWTKVNPDYVTRKCDHNRFTTKYTIPCLDRVIEKTFASDFEFLWNFSKVQMPIIKHYTKVSFCLWRVSFCNLLRKYVGDLFSMKGAGEVELGPSTKLVSGHCVWRREESVRQKVSIWKADICPNIGQSSSP